MSLQWEKEQFDAAYGADRYGPSWAAVHRLATGLPVYATLAETLQGRFTNKNNSFLVVGCGFGYMVHHLLSLGYTNVWAVDASSYISSNIATGRLSPFNFVHGKIEDPATQAALKAASGINTFDYICTEAIMESYDPAQAEFATVLSSIRSLLKGGQVQGRIAHLVYDHHPGQRHVSQPDFWQTWLSLEEWETAALAAGHTHVWVSAYNAVVRYNGAVQ